MNERLLTFEVDEDGAATAQFDENTIEIALSGPAVNGRIHGYVADSANWAAVCDETRPQRALLLITGSALARHLNERVPSADLSTNDWTDDDVRAAAVAITAAVLTGDTVAPEPDGTFPEPFDDAAVSEFEVSWEGFDGSFEPEWMDADRFEMQLPNTDGHPSGRFNAEVVVNGHQATWSEWFMDGGMASDAPAWGWAGWTDDTLLIAGGCPDLEDAGYFCFRLSEPPPTSEEAMRSWRVALARAVISRGKLPLFASYGTFWQVED